MSTAARVDLFLLRNRILIAERIVARQEARVAKWTAWSPQHIPQLLSEAQADLKVAQEHLTTLRAELAAHVAPLLTGVQ